MNMTTSVERRRFLKSIAAAGLILPGMSIYQHALADVDGLDLGSAQPFDFADLIARAKSIATSAYEPPVAPNPEIVGKIDYDTHGKLHYKRDHSPFSDGSGTYPLTFFHLGMYFAKPVHMHLVDGGKSRLCRFPPA